MKQKPQYLYHGSQYQIGVIKPMQAHGVCDAESQQAIYAAATMEEVIPFALPFRRYPDSPEGKRSFESNGINSYLRYGSIDPNGKGYIYVLPSESFELIDEWEWISRTEVKPVEVIEIKVKDYPWVSKVLNTVLPTSLNVSIVYTFTKSKQIGHHEE